MAARQSDGTRSFHIGVKNASQERLSRTQDGNHRSCSKPSKTQGKMFYSTDRIYNFIPSPIFGSRTDDFHGTSLEKNLIRTVVNLIMLYWGYVLAIILSTPRYKSNAVVCPWYLTSRSSYE